jgi:hypothetical protein
LPVSNAKKNDPKSQKEERDIIIFNKKFSGSYSEVIPCGQNGTTTMPGIIY